MKSHLILFLFISAAFFVVPLAAQVNHHYQSDFSKDELAKRRNTILDAIGNKAVALLQGAAGILGDEVFWKGIRSYYAKFMNRNSSTSDFRVAMEEASGKDLEYFFDQWLYKPGTLRIKGNWQYYTEKKELTIKLDQVQDDESIFLMPLQISIQLTGKPTPLKNTIFIREKSNVYTLSLDSEPVAVVLDPDSWVLMDAEFEKNN